MQICICVDPAHVLGWHLRLRDDLSAAGHEATLCRTDKTGPWPASLKLTMLLERILFRLPSGQVGSIVDVADICMPSVRDMHPADPFDVVVNCTGGFGPVPSSRRLLTPLYNGHPSELSAWEAIVDSREVEIAVQLGVPPGLILDRGSVALENREVVSTSLNNICSGAGDLILKAIGRPDARPPGDPVVCIRQLDAQALPTVPGGVFSLAERVARKLARRLTGLAKAPSRWGVAWRKIDGVGLLETRARETRRVFKLVADDGRRYYADPFLFAFQGQDYVFVEEFPLATSKGVISACAIGPDGTLGSPRIVLEEATHLSYPQVFADSGQIWMIPESGESRCISLYRAASFPDTWVKECDLVAGTRAYDATLHRDAAGYWLFATPERWQGTSWDRLSVFHAPSLKGPWKSHADNPVQLNPRSSRSAGHLFPRDGEWHRLAQDGSNSYGGAIAVCRIDELTPDRYRQSVVGRITARHLGRDCGIHTYNRCGGLEVVDVFAPLERSNTAEVAYRMFDVPETVRAEVRSTERETI